jgi:hypothetical protein
MASMRDASRTIRRRWHTLRDFHAHGGAGAVLWQTLYVLGYHRTVVVELSLTPPPSPVATEVEVVFGFLTPEQVDAFAAHHPDVSAGQAAARLARGERCFATWVGDRIVSSRWIESGRVRFGDVGLDVDLPPGTVYVSHSFTNDDMRGMRIASASGTELAIRLAAEGCTRLIGTVLPHNRSGLRSAMHAGYTQTERVATICLPFLPAVRVPFLPPHGPRSLALD